jgi:tetratricopeptide (TPR) repeat protein
MGPAIRNWVIGLLVASILALANELGRAQDQKETDSDQDQNTWAACADVSKNADAGIEACTSILRDAVHLRLFALINRGQGWKKKGELDHAVSDFSEAIGIDPNFPRAYVERGNLYRDKGQCDQAIADYDRALRLLPDRAEIYVSRGACWIGKGEYDPAMANFDDAIRLDPNNANGIGALAWSMKGRVWFLKGDFDRAIADYNEAIRLNPQRIAFFIDRGYASTAKGDYDRALEDYDTAIKLDPTNANGSSTLTWRLKGSLRYQKGDLEGAISDFSEAIRLDPKGVSLFMDRGYAWNRKGDYDRALADFDAAINLDPKLALAYEHRGNVYRSKGDYSRAIADYDQAIKLQPDELSAFGGRGLTRFYLGDFAKAADDFARVAERRSDDAYAMLLLYVSRARAGRRDAASELAKSIQKLKAGEWPYPIVELYLGRKSLAAIEAAPTKHEERCEAQFYIGEFHLARGARPLAAKALQMAVDTCPKDFVEYRGAVEELKRVKP